MRSLRPLGPLLLAALAACGSCKKSEPAAPVTPPTAQGPANPAPPAAVDAGPADFAPTPSTLSYLEPAQGHCQWVKADHVSKKRFVLASVEGACTGGKLSLSHDQTRAALWFDPTANNPAAFNPEAAFKDPMPDEKGVDRIWLVHLDGGAPPQPATAPRLGELHELGFGPDGGLFALTLSDTSEEQQKKGFLEVDGERFTFEGEKEGIPVLVHAFTLTPAGWKRVETKLSTEGWDYAQGVKALEAGKTLGFRSTAKLEPRIQGDSLEDAALRKQLFSLSPSLKPEEGSWIRMGPLLLWEITAEFTYSTGAFFFRGPSGELVRPEKNPFTHKDVVVLQLQAPYLLVNYDTVGVHPRLFDTQTGKLLWSSDTAGAATFWPGTASPSEPH